MVEVLSGSVQIHASTEDYNKVEGLCGTFTGKCEDDFLLRGGTYNPFPSPGVCATGSFAVNYPEFSASWRYVWACLFTEDYV